MADRAGTAQPGADLRRQGRGPGRSRLAATAHADPREVSRGAWAQSVFAATTHLNVRCDVAGTVIALTRPGRDVGRAAELVDWIAHTDPGERRRTPEIVFGEPLRPVVVAVSTDALPELFDTDVSAL